MNLRDFEDGVLEGRIVVPHAPWHELVAMVERDIALGAPDASWAVDGVAEGQELPRDMESALRAHFGC